MTDIKTLNVGCGSDSWGDVRLDIASEYYGRKATANIYADAQNLPFRDGVFMSVRANNILEHLPLWKQALREWCRVTKELEVLVPIDAGFLKREIYVEILSGNLRGILELPKRRRGHLWQFKPQNIIKELRRNRFNAKLIMITGPLMFRDDNRLSTFRFIKWVRNNQKKTNLHFKIIARRVSEKSSYPKKRYV